MYLRKKKGQSTLEYTLIVAAIIAAIVAVAVNIQTKTQNSLDKAGDTLESAAGEIDQMLNNIPAGGE